MCVGEFLKHLNLYREESTMRDLSVFILKEKYKYKIK